MAPFPITARFVGDVTAQLVAIDTDDTWDQVGEKAAVHTVGRRMPAPDPHPGYEVLLNGSVLPGQSTVADLFAANPVPPLQWFDIRFRVREVHCD